MKMTRKLIPALVMLLVSAIMLSTASYAWFANNTQVQANGMTVEANTDFRFLQISNAINGTYGTSASPAALSPNKLDLVHAELAGSKGSYTGITWTTGTSDDPSLPASNSSTTTLRPDQILTGDAAATHTDGVNTYAYVLYNTFYVKMSEGNENAAPVANLTVKGVAITGDNSLAEAVRVLVVAEDTSDGVTKTTYQIWDCVGNTKLFGDDVLFAEVGYTAEKISIYVYFDGADESATTNNATDSGESTVTVTFDVSAS